jgi:glycerol uptake facilitator-like aquaporin
MKRIATEILGTIVLTFMVQLITEKKMTFIEHNREFYICIPIYYMIARTYSSKSNAVNPAFGIGFETVWCLKNNDWSVFPMTYIIVVGPSVGAILSALCF